MTGRYRCRGDFGRGPSVGLLDAAGTEDTKGFDEMLGMALTDQVLEIEGCSNDAKDRAVDVEGTSDGVMLNVLGTLDDWAVGQSEMLGWSDS